MCTFVATKKRNIYISSMEIKGTIIQALPEQSGISKAGNAWKKREYVLENTEGQFPRKICFTCFGENADRIQLTPGQRVTMHFDLESREYNGRWYTEVRCWRADVEAPEAAAGPVSGPGTGGVVPPVMPAAQEDEFPF